MSTEEQKPTTNLKTNVLKFPGIKNEKVEEQQKEFAKLLMSIQMKMNEKTWQNMPISHKELLLLSEKNFKKAKAYEIQKLNIRRNNFLKKFISSI